MKQLKMIRCQARVCTSIIRLARTEINMGDCNVGQQKVWMRYLLYWFLTYGFLVQTAVVEVVNLSDLPAPITLELDSKVISFKKKNINVPPRQSYEFEMYFIARRINPDYRKEIKIVNTMNAENHLILEVRANNIDQHRITLHSQFYKLLNVSGTNQIMFDTCIINCPKVRITPS